MTHDPRTDPNLTVETIRHVDDICTVFERNWRRGERPAIEDFLADKLGPERSALLCELLALELEYRLLAGERPESAEYARRFPADGDIVDLTFREAAEFTKQDERAANGSPINNGRHESAINRLPRVFGDYELLEEIARGGMGVVYKARQLSLDRMVAMKMILTGQLASLVEVERFYAEAQASAKLHHPGIVPIIDVGQRDGQHFFAMGLIDGVSLAQQLADGPLPPQQAAELLQSITAAVQYAHERGVIHRDLKPANILLDADGQPHITDFGLAKRASHDASLTATGQIIGTPSFMPPEQATGKMAAIGPASDVYSLGAVLYAALTGRPPFQAANTVDTLKQLAEREPVAPRKLNVSVPRDLETICLKCLQKDPRRRYATAQVLADELARWLAGKPILARPVARIERTWRWARRQPVVAGLAALALVSLTSGMVVSIYFAVQAQHQAAAASRNAVEERNQRLRAEDSEKKATAEKERAEVAEKNANTEKERAEVQTATAQEVSNFLVGLVQGADPIGLSGYSLGQTQKVDVNTTALELLDRGAQMVQEKLFDQPEVQAKLMQAIGDVYTSFFKLDAAEPLLKQSLEVRRQRFGAKDLQVAASLHSLAAFHFIEGDFEGSENLFREALAIRRELLGEGDLDVAMSEFALGWVLQFSRGRRDRELEGLMRAALRTRLTILGPAARDVGLARLGLAFFLIKADKPLPALQEMTAALPTFETAGGDNRAASALSAYMRGIAAQRRNRSAEAADYFEQAVNQITALFGGEHPITNYVKCELADAQLAGRDGPAAERVYREALDSNRKLLGRRPFVARSLESFAILLYGHGRYDEADSMLKEAIEIQSDPPADESVLAGELWYQRGHVAVWRGDLRSAVSGLHKAVKIYGKKDPAIYSGSVWDTAVTLSLLALHEGNLPIYREGCRILVGSRQVSDYLSDDATAAELTAWVCVLHPDALDDPLLAVRIAEDAVAANGDTQKFERALGAALYRAEQIDEAIEHLDSACRLDSEGTDLAAQLFLAMAYYKAGHVEKANTNLDRLRALVAEKISDLGSADPDQAPSGVPQPDPSAALSAVAREHRSVFLPLILQDRVALKPLFLEAVSVIGETTQ